MSSPFTVSVPIAYLGEWIVEIHLNGEFWDHRTFETEAEALAFQADPLADDRARSRAKAAREAAQEAEMARYRAAGLERISKGRRVGRKPGAA